MIIRDLFSEQGALETIQRINNLQPGSKPEWGKMSVDQMLAHCNVAYDMAFLSDNYKKPGAFGRFMIKLFVKNAVVGPKPYPKNGRTAPEFIIEGSRNFEDEKVKLINYIRESQKLGRNHFENKASVSMGPLTADEWNTTFSKHLDHHLMQFNV